MGIPWADDAEIGSGDIFETLHNGLTVVLIATEREELATCRPNESLSDVVLRNVEEYDHLPVEDDIVGLLHDVTAKRSSTEGTAREHFRAPSEEDLIGVDANI